MIRRYLLNILIWCDIGLNVFCFGGSPYETISSRAGKHADNGKQWACVFCAWLSAVLGKNHCKRAEVPDYGDDLSEVNQGDKK